MVKDLNCTATAITEEQVVQDDDNENSTYQRFLGSIKSFFGFGSSCAQN